VGAGGVPAYDLAYLRIAPPASAARTMKNKKIREIILGKPLDPMKSETRHSMALVAFLAWVGLGADGLSSSSYGPEETFRALGAHTHLGLYMASPPRSPSSSSRSPTTR
jgi:hypothetical protein